MKVTSSICAKNCVFAIEENKSGFCRNVDAKKLMGQAWAPLKGYDCPFYFTEEMVNAFILSKRTIFTKLSSKQIRNVLDSFGVPHEVHTDDRIYKVSDIISYFCSRDHTPQESKKITAIYIQLARNGLTDNDTFAVPRPRWANGVEY